MRDLGGITTIVGQCPSIDVDIFGCTVIQLDPLAKIVTDCWIDHQLVDNHRTLRSDTAPLGIRNEHTLEIDALVDGLGLIVGTFRRRIAALWIVDWRVNTLVVHHIAGVHCADITVAAVFVTVTAPGDGNNRRRMPTNVRHTEVYVTGVTVITHRISQALNKGFGARAIALDISKAFDKVWHKGLLLKLSSYGISGKVHATIKSFLSNRSLRVVIKGQCFPDHSINAGVPQVLFWAHLSS